MRGTVSKVLTNIARNISELLCLRSQISFVRADGRQLLRCPRSVPGADTGLSSRGAGKTPCGAQKLLLASELYTVTAAGGLWRGDRFVERKDSFPCRWKGKERDRYNVLSLSSSCQEGKSRVKSNFHFNLSQRGKIGLFKWSSRVTKKSF